jgi:hypothetical protein
MKQLSHIELPVDESTAAVLRRPMHREIMAALVIRMTTPWNGEDPLTGMLDGEILLRQASTRPVSGLTAGQAAWVKGQPTGQMSDEELMAPSATLITVADIVTRAEKTWGGAMRAREWLFRRNMALGGRPIDLLATTDGALMVATLVMRIEAGVAA